MKIHLPSASLFSHAIDSQFFVLLAVSSFLVAMVFGLMIFLCIKYRKNSQANRDSPPNQSIPLEATIIFLILAVGMITFFVSAKVYYQMYSPPKDAREIFVVAKQWMWTFHDPNSTDPNSDHINELRVTLGVPVRLTMISEDVIHSFFVPAFRVKQDVLPDRYTSLWFTPTQLGDFEVLCTQYCGLRHSQMRAVIHVVPSQAKLSKVTTNSTGGEALLREKGCMSCHQDGGATRSIGPSFNHLFESSVELANGKIVNADENYLRKSIYEPNAEIVKGYSAIMPSFAGILSETETTLIIDAIRKRKAEKTK